MNYDFRTVFAATPAIMRQISLRTASPFAGYALGRRRRGAGIAPDAMGVATFALQGARDRSEA